MVSHEVSWGKLQLLRIFGVEIIVNDEPICPDPNDKTSGIYKAEQLGNRNGYFNPGQYDNGANPAAHAKWTAPQIWQQTEGKLSVFCAGLGTTGTMHGAGSYFKNKSKAITTVGVVRCLNNPIPGVRTLNLLRQIAFDWRKVTDNLEEVGTVAAFQQSLALCRAGLMVGPSSGFSLAGLINYLNKRKSAHTLDGLRNQDGEIVAVFICPDSPLPYLDDYFIHLDQDNFPPIANEHLLLNKPGSNLQSDLSIHTSNPEITAADAFDLISKPATKKNIKLIDVRNVIEFNDNHLSGAKNIELAAALKNIPDLVQKWQGKTIIIICQSGNRSLIAAKALRQAGLEAFSLQGGMTEWSRLRLPRWRPDECLINQVNQW